MRESGAAAFAEELSMPSIICPRSILALAAACVTLSLAAQTPPAAEWESYGRTAGGDRYSPLTQIAPANVAGLDIAWRYRTGEAAPASAANVRARFSATPIMIGGRLY